MNNTESVIESVTSDQVVISMPALIAFSSRDLSIDYYIRRHIAGDWGLVSEKVIEGNQLALENGGKTLSHFHVGGHFLEISTKDQKIDVKLLDVNENSKLMEVA
jgi:hypothetical protein